MEKQKKLENLIDIHIANSEIGHTINPIAIKYIVEKYLGSSININIKNIENLKINLTNEQIKKYLETKEIENYPNIEERIENQRIMKAYFSSLNKNDELYKIFQNSNKMNILHYYYEPSILINYTNYINKLKQIISNIFNLINELETSYINDTIFNKKDELLKKNIRISENGYIHYEDIINLINSLDKYIVELEQIVEIANNLDTYLNFPIYDKLLYKFGVMTYESQRDIKQKTKVPNK